MTNTNDIVERLRQILYLWHNGQPINDRIEEIGEAADLIEQQQWNYEAGCNAHEAREKEIAKLEREAEAREATIGMHLARIAQLEKEIKRLHGIPSR